MTNDNQFDSIEQAVIHLFSALVDRDTCVNSEDILCRSMPIFCTALDTAIRLSSADMPEYLRDVVRVISNAYLPEGFGFSRIFILDDYYEVDVATKEDTTIMTYKGQSLFDVVDQAISESHKLFENEGVSDAK